MTFPIYGKIQVMFQSPPTSSPRYHGNMSFKLLQSVRVKVHLRSALEHDPAHVQAKKQSTAISGNLNWRYIKYEA